jgi:hypothetical protein
MVKLLFMFRVSCLLHAGSGAGLDETPDKPLITVTAFIFTWMSVFVVFGACRV